MADRQNYIDLVQYIKVRTRCSTGRAHEVLKAGVLRVDGKPIGVDPEGRVVSWVPAELRDQIEVVFDDGK